MPDLQTKRKEIETALITRAEADSEFRSKLLSNPNAALEEATGIRFEEDVKIEVHEETPTHLHLVLPVTIGMDGELSDDHLESVAGGGSFPDPLAGAKISAPLTLGMNSTTNLSLGESTLVISGPPASEGSLTLDLPSSSGIKMISTTGAQPKFKNISNSQQQSGPPRTPAGSGFSLGQGSK